MNALTDNEVAAMMAGMHYLLQGLRAQIDTGVEAENARGLLANIEQVFPLLRDRRPMSFAQFKTAVNTLQIVLCFQNFVPVWRSCIVFASPEELKANLATALRKLESSVPMPVGGTAGGVC